MASLDGVFPALEEQLGQAFTGEVRNLANSLIMSQPGATNQDVITSVLQAVNERGAAATSAAFSDFLGTQSVGETQDPMALINQLLGSNQNTPAAFSLEQLQGLGLSPDAAQAALLEQFGLNSGYGGYGGGGDTASAQTNASANYMNALTNAARQRADQSYQEGQLLVQQGQLDLAEQQFAASEYWTGVANDLSQRQFQLEAAATPAQIATSMFNAQTTDAAQRGALELGAGNTYSGLASLLGSLATTQAQMGINLLTTPRNAVAAFLLGQGSDPSKAAQFGQFNVERLLGINPAQIQDMIAGAVSAAEAARTRADTPNTINLQTFLDALSNTARDVSSGKTGETGDSGTNLPAGWSMKDGKYVGPDPFKNKKSGSTPQPEENFQRTPTGSTAVRPNNPVVRQVLPVVGRGDVEPDRGPFVTPAAQPTARDTLVNILLGNQGSDLATNVRRSLFPEDTSYL